ncbi:orotidine 5'-phosphate decarboxylase / HUMPS family protein [Rugosimonospora africana]|uniref:HTH cro/C1-type domain-containing protein n=1 Tax=Rugosimonospora africana TaxID=556532 RepID=A0A8J3VWW0_9ACTN|nr:orotidine 5'-phosphate decarboxylase / HUMPS family protein [Rugosimonospora africana]GIH21294.1 hypothetical protein Raf01_94660 [Rugosimonospora africana]
MPVATVRRWTGREARALRMAERMSVRQFAAHLGLTPASVSNWERRGVDAQLRYETQQILDLDLARCGDDVQERFDRALSDDQPALVGIHDTPAPDDGNPAARLPDPLGRTSARRTQVLLHATAGLRDSPLRYAAPVDPADTVAEFVASPARVYVITGPPGSGKTRLTYHLAEQTDMVDFQLHSADGWATRPFDLAVEILRYASVQGGDDPLLALERECSTLSRPLLIVIDGPRTGEQVHELCQQVDLVLRQVLTDRLRFCLVVRTPPAVEFSAYPVLSATVMRQSASAAGSSLQLGAWSVSQARAVWDRGCVSEDPSFNQLPARVRQLARLPLYMHLLKTAGNCGAVGEPTAYRLVDFCVRSIMASTGGNVEALMMRLTALAESELPHLLPRQLVPGTMPKRDGNSPAPSFAQPWPPLLQPSASGAMTFAHDVVREYLLASRVAQLIEEQGRSSGTVAAFNELAAQAGCSATSRGVLEFAVQCLDSTAPDLLTAVSLSPTIGITATLPLMIEVAGHDAAFVTDEVLRSCASRSLHDSGANLAKALLQSSRLAETLAGRHAPWLVEILRQFGSAIWPDVVAYAEQRLSASSLLGLLEAADFNNAADAVFFARHATVFFGDDGDLTAKLKTLVEHPDWRVRAALANGLHAQPAPHPAADAVFDVLIRDRDYKVRAAAADAVGRTLAKASVAQVRDLALDDNWHVRERLIRGLASLTTPVLDDQLRAILVTESSWRECPAHVRTWLERLLIVAGVPRTAPTPAYDKALFGLVREIRTGSLQPPPHVHSRLIALARASSNSLVANEAAALDPAAPPKPDIRGRREMFRRLRDSRAVQVALDLRDVDQAVTVAAAAAAAGAQFIEVGDPLIKSAGVAAIERVKQAVPGIAVVAEMMSADWGRDQVILAAEAGADIVLLIGPASVASVSAAVEASTRLGLPLVLDVPPRRAEQSWVQAMERVGVDGFAITTNIDLGVAGQHPLDQARALRSWTRLPVAISGGFGIADDSVYTDPTWDILVVGRSVADAVVPAAAATRLIDHIRTYQTGRCNDH